MREKLDGSAGNLCGGTRRGDTYRGNIPRGAVAVRDGVSADWVRLRLLSAAVRKERLQ